MDTRDPHFIAGYLSNCWSSGLGITATLPDWVKKAQETFPDVDLVYEIRQAVMWEAANPRRKKKKIRPYLTRWFGKAQANAERKGAKAPVVCIDSARWLKRADRAPEKQLTRWLAGRGAELSAELVGEYCSYFSVASPVSAESVVEMYAGRG